MSIEFQNYSGAVLVKAIEQLESLAKPLAGPLHNTLVSLRTALKKRNDEDLNALTPIELRLLLDALREDQSTDKNNRVLGRTYANAVSTKLD